ncbi:cysteine-rich CWC family protein [Metabacillus arenae]|uniref:Cysteine-rich CWC family protein n=1 Tax=Metabacillus arenae TaxID=2771434 RepID=A0A926NE59_9BACI|nr:cysteine-rich CWC family protein [Metabacillus arenae]MBD1379586.1 cysteine-rich CWC family protein [Metabacillus arenae]
MANIYCPMCGEKNDCMTGAGEHGNCWCDKEVFPNEIFKLVPEESRRKHCVCINCFTKFKEEQKIK